MKLAFRQGLVSFQQDANGRPQFLQPSVQFGFVALNVSPTPVVATFAHKDGNYLQVFDKTTNYAWGPLVVDNDNYLYWDIDLLTAEVTTGITLFEPIVSSVEPVQINDLHWFDLNEIVMKVWSTRYEKWVSRVRVFAGVALNGSTNQIVSKIAGTQIGNLDGTDSGYIILDSQLRPLRTSTGVFLTSQTNVRVKTTSGTSGVLASPLNAFIPVRAGQNIPAMSVVYFSGEDEISVASSDPIYVNEKIPFGIVQEDLAINQIGNLTQQGEIVYDQWDWSGKFGSILYIDSFGKLTTVRPQGLLAYHVGVVKNKNTIIFGIDAETQPQVYQATAAQMIVAGQTPVTAYTTTNSLGERITTIGLSPGTTESAGSISPAQIQTIESVETRFSTVENNITNLFTNKANLRHTHVTADITDLQPLLDGKMPINKNFDDRYAPININFDSRYAALAHTHPITQISGLQSAIDSKANRFGSLVSISSVWQNVDRTGATDIGSGTSLQAVLDGKALLLHTHAIADIVNLQTTLDSKAMLNHTHSISQITSLQSNLDSKVNLTGDQTLTGQFIMTVPPTDDFNLATKIYVDTKFASIPPSTSGVDRLMNLVDVDNSAHGDYATGSVLTFDANNNKWIPSIPSNPGAEYLFDLLDVQPPAYGQFYNNNVLTWNANASQWEPKDILTIISQANNGNSGNVDITQASVFDLNDVNHNPNTNDMAGQVLTFDGSNFYPDFIRMEKIFGFNIPNVYSTIANGSVLTWNGTKFAPAAIPTQTGGSSTPGATALAALSDVQLTDSLSDNDLIHYDASSTKWKSTSVQNTLSNNFSISWANDVEEFQFPLHNGDQLVYDTVKEKFVIKSAPNHLLYVVQDGSDASLLSLNSTTVNRVVMAYNTTPITFSIQDDPLYEAGDEIIIQRQGTGDITINFNVNFVSNSILTLTQPYEVITFRAVTSGNNSTWIVLNRYNSASSAAPGSAFSNNEIAPASPALGDRWYVPSTAKLYTRINDGTSDQWVEL